MELSEGKRNLVLERDCCCCCCCCDDDCGVGVAVWGEKEILGFLIKISNSIYRNYRVFQLQGEGGAEHSDERVLPRPPMETDGTGSAPGEGGRSLAPQWTVRLL